MGLGRLDPELILDGVENLLMGSLSGVNYSIGLWAQSGLGEDREGSLVVMLPRF